jgi:hypothetical protein
VLASRQAFTPGSLDLPSVVPHFCVAVPGILRSRAQRAETGRADWALGSVADQYGPRSVAGVGAPTRTRVDQRPYHGSPNGRFGSAAVNGRPEAGRDSTAIVRRKVPSQPIRAGGRLPSHAAGHPSCPPPRVCGVPFRRMGDLSSLDLRRHRPPGRSGIANAASASQRLCSQRRPAGCARPRLPGRPSRVRPRQGPVEEPRPSTDQGHRLVGESRWPWLRILGLCPAR